MAITVERQANCVNFLRIVMTKMEKSRLKWIKSLQLKKYRQAEQCFLVQGYKGVEVLLESDFEVLEILSTNEFSDRLSDKIQLKKTSVKHEVVSTSTLESIGSFQTNDTVLAVARMKPEAIIKPGAGRVLLLDTIRDPGNLGTMLRTADWFGVNKIVLSPTCVDFYNPKVISASMGSFCHVDFCYMELPEFIHRTTVPVYGAFLNGADIHSVTIEPNGLICIGNESNGISPEVEACITHRVTIPGYGRAESLNASVAAGIFLYCASRS
jgi:TrmH family RNA methyltransferase